MTKSQSNSLVVSASPSSVELTVYHGGPAVVREARKVSLDEGRSNLQIDGLPLQFVGGSLTVVSAEGAGPFKMHSTSFRNANLSLDTILQKAIGQHVVLCEAARNGAVIQHTGKLLYIIDGRTAVLQESDDQDSVQLVPLTNKVELTDGLPEGLSALSSLVMDVSTGATGDYDINTLYESEGLAWRPWYEFIYDSEASVLKRLACFVELTNSSGTDMEDARLSLIAGHNHSVNARPKGRGVMRAQAMSASFEAQVESAGGGMDYEEADVETVGNQRMYTLPDSVTLVNGETLNPALVFAEDVPVTQEFHLNESWYGSRRELNDDDLPKLPISVKLRAKNDKASNLGIPLPPASGRVLEPDSTGQLQKTDNSRVTGHVAANEKFVLDLTVPSKDLKATRELTFQHIDPEPEEVKDDNFVDEGGMPDDDPRFEVQPMADAVEGGPSLTAMTATPTVIDEGKHDRIRRDAAKRAGEAKEEKKPEPRFQEEERVIRLFNYGTSEETVIVHENVAANAEFLDDKTGFHRINEESYAGVFEVTVPAGTEDEPGEREISYRIKWQIN